MGLKNRNITGILGFDVARTTTAPNATIPVHSIKATGTEANIDFAIVPKGNGAIVAQLPDNTIAGGNKRGTKSVDLQQSRTSASQVASGANSFVGGGGSNTASGQYSAVVGGNSNTASSANSFVGGGQGNTASNYYSVVAGGQMNTADAWQSFVSGGYSNTASGNNSFIGGGSSNTASESFATIGGGRYQYAYILSQAVSGGCNSNANKVRQDSKLTMQKNTTAATSTEMFIDSSTSRAVLKDNCAWAFDITILAHSSTNVLHTARFKRSGLILRGATAATTTLEGAVQTIGTDIINSNLAGCDVAISADTTNGSLKVEVTGIAATTIIWQAKIELVEIEI